MKLNPLYYVAALIILVAGAYILVHPSRSPRSLQDCTMEARICPDGSAVGRTGPNCEFAACPNGNAPADHTGIATFDSVSPSPTHATFTFTNTDGQRVTRGLVFTEKSMCGSAGLQIPCMALSVTLDMPFGNTPIRVIGVDNGLDITVQSIQRMSGSETGSATVTAAMDQRVSTNDISITPISVDDSRCPVGVNCIWAGTVKVSVKIESGLGMSTSTIELGKTVTTEAEEIEFTDVSPQKTAQTEPSDYRFTFRITKR